MLTIGVTGGIASGKSAAMRCLSELGCVCFSADEAARAVLQPGGSLLQRIAFRFGAGILKPNGELDRSRLASVVFTDKSARTDLEALMHPPIVNLLLAQMDSVSWDFPPTAVVAIEIPLLFETKLEGLFHFTLNIEVPPEVQLARLITRNRLSNEAASARIGSQLNNAQRRDRATHTIQNTGTISELSSALSTLISRHNLSRDL